MYPLRAIINACVALDIHPNVITFVGVIPNVAAAFALGTGHFVLAGVIMVFDETTDLVGTLRRIAQFFRDESCGQCVPCSVGSVRQEELLARLAGGSRVRAREDELVLLQEIGQAMRDASICGLGQTASSAIESALRHPGMVAL